MYTRSLEWSVITFIDICKVFCITKHLYAVDTSIYFNSICHIITLLLLFNYQMKVETAFIKKNKNKEKKTDKKEGSKESKKKDEEKKKDEKKDKEKKEEVAKDEKKEPFIFKNVRESSAYQHGAELLIEKENSVFQSGVAGIICIGTKVSTFDKLCLNEKGIV